MLGTGNPAAEEVTTAPTPTLPLHLLLFALGFFSDLFFSLISDLFVHLPTPVPDGL